MTKYFDKWRKGAKKGKGGKYYMPAKRKGAKNKTSVQARTEFKDRVKVNQPAHALSTIAGSVANGPEDSYIIIPGSMFDAMTQGNLNGQFEGNQITPKKLNMKIKLNFDSLNPMGGAGTGPDPYVPQSYYIMITQGWIKITLKEAGALTGIHNNASSGKKQPAFASGANPTLHAGTVAKRALFQANFTPEFLTYEKRDYGDVKILRRFRVYGEQQKKFVTPVRPRVPHPAATVEELNSVAPERCYSFNWKMVNKKQELAPVIDATTTYGNPESWIPFCMVTMSTDHTLHAGSHLTVEHCDHFTYSDI